MGFFCVVCFKNQFFYQKDRKATCKDCFPQPENTKRKKKNKAALCKCLLNSENQGQELIVAWGKNDTGSEKKTAPDI